MGHEFWTENPRALVENFRLFPASDSTLEEKMNAITRIVIIVFIILLVLKNKRSGIFLVVSIVLIVLLYYYLRQGKPSKEKSSTSSKKNSSEDKWGSEERFMAHAGRDKEVNDPSKTDFVEGQPGMKKKAHPRRPFPAAIPEDFVVHTPNPPLGQTSSSNVNDRAQYLQSLRARKAQLDEEDEIRELEQAIFAKATGNKFGRADNIAQEDEEYTEDIMVSGTRHPPVSRFVAVNDDIDDPEPIRSTRVRLGKSVAAKDRYSDSSGTERVDPFELQMRKDTRGLAQRQKFQQDMRSNFRNSNQ